MWWTVITGVNNIKLLYARNMNRDKHEKARFRDETQKTYNYCDDPYSQIDK